MTSGRALQVERGIPQDGQIPAWSTADDLAVWVDDGGGAVDSVNGQTGAVVLTGDDVGPPEAHAPTHEAGGSDPITVDALEVTDATDVRILTTNGPPASTTGPGALYYTHGVTAVYLNTSGDLDVPVWTAQPSGGGITTGDELPGTSSGTDEWFIQAYFDALSFQRDLYQGDGVGGWAGVGGLQNGNYVAGTVAPTDAADATGVGVAGPGSRLIDRTTAGADGWYTQVGTLDAPVWAPLFASFDQTFGSGDGVLGPGAFRLINMLFPAGTTYVQIKKCLASSNAAEFGQLLGLPFGQGVRIAAMLNHQLPDAAEAAGIRLKWHEQDYLFRAYETADGVLWTELADNSTVLDGLIIQMLAIGYVP